MADSLTVCAKGTWRYDQNIPGHGVLNDTCVHAKSICVGSAEVGAADVIREGCFGGQKDRVVLGDRDYQMP